MKPTEFEPRYEFRVPGTPVPAPRTTHRSKWTKRFQRYADYCDKCRAKFIDKYKKDSAVSRCLATAEKPFAFDDPRGKNGGSDIQAMVQYAIKWPGTKADPTRCDHGDPDNVGKTIVDALFADDNHVISACTQMVCRAGRGNGELAVRIFPAPERRDLINFPADIE